MATAPAPFVGQNVAEIEGTLYRSIQSTIANGVTNQLIAITPLTQALSVMIENTNALGAAGVLKVRFEDAANDVRSIAAGDDIELDDFYFTKIYLTNDSGTTVAYSIFLIGS